MVKRIIVLLGLVFACLGLNGCDDDELIEIGEVSHENSVGANENALDMDGEKQAKDTGVAENIDKTAEDSDMDSRPFVVYVCGEVKNPGVYEVSEGSRIIDAVEVSGGFTKDAAMSFLNMAELVIDGEKIYVPSLDEACDIESTGSINSGAVGTLSTGMQESSGTSKVNINNASREQLMTLKGVGESKADKIIAYRNEHGKFNSIEDIMNISGIKEGMFNKIKDQICVR